MNSRTSDGTVTPPYPPPSHTHTYAREIFSSHRECMEQSNLSRLAKLQQSFPPSLSLLNAIAVEDHLEFLI